MEEKKSDSGLVLNQRNFYHKILMTCILKQLSDTPLVLKGGTALYLGYGLTRFSEDLDFDSSKRLNLLNKIKEAFPLGIRLLNINIKKDTETVTRYLIDYSVDAIKLTDKLKIEISYRTPIQEDLVCVKDGIRYAPIEQLIDYKLKAAFDGDNTRSKCRDLYDLHFLAKNYSESFNVDTAKRLYEFSKDPDVLVSRYDIDVKDDQLLRDIMDTESISLELSDLSRAIYLKQKEKQENQSLNNQEQSLSLKRREYMNEQIQVKAKADASKEVNQASAVSPRMAMMQRNKERNNVRDNVISKTRNGKSR